MAVRTAKPGRHGDGGGLYLFVRSPEARFWLFRYVRKGRMREAGLGPAAGRDAVSLADARTKAAEMRKLHKSGIDPLAQREADAAQRKAAEQQAAAEAVTFNSVSDFYISAHAAGWRNAKHQAQWRATLETYCAPVFGSLPVGQIETGHVMQALDPIWREKPETATRVRGRIEAVLDFATTRGWRSGDNPARWRGHLANLLPARAKVARVEHHPALPWREMAGFMVELASREDDSVAAMALRFTILTAARSGETLGARWSEVAMAEAVWTVPGERMKAGREHRVPLSDAALAVLREAEKLRTSAADGFVFPGQRTGKALSNMSMAMLLRRMKRDDLSVHGFRSTFRDWCAEATAFDRETAEGALAHTVRDKVEAAYRRGDLFEKRRKLMEAWARYCATPAAAAGTDVVAIRATVAAS